MSKKYNGGPAFPSKVAGVQHCSGMTLRDWFAGQALIGLLTGQETTDAMTAAKYAAQYADALIEELERDS